VSTLSLEDLLLSYKSKLCVALAGNAHELLYPIVPDLQKLLNDLSFSQKQAVQDIQPHLQEPHFIELKSMIAEATQRMEIHAQKRFLEHLRSFDENGKILFIQSLGSNASFKDCSVLDFERLPELGQEHTKSELRENDRLLILGTGSISLTGLYHASKGVDVMLLDRDPRAINTFSMIYPDLPKKIQNKIKILDPIDAINYDYSSCNCTHIFMAALLDPKGPIINKIVQKTKTPKKLIVRVPRKDLMELFYYGLPEEDKDLKNSLSLLSTVDLGETQTSVTKIFQINHLTPQ
jgi:hypothetical protein